MPTDYEMILAFGKVYKEFEDEGIECPKSFIVRYKNVYYLLRNWSRSRKEVIRIGVES